MNGKRYYIGVMIPLKTFGGCVLIPEIAVHTTVFAKRTLDRWRKEICLD